MLIARRPRIVEPRCLRCRTALVPAGEYAGSIARCQNCGAGYDWLGAGEDTDA